MAVGTTKVVDVGELNEDRSSRNWHFSVRAFLRFCSLIRKGKKHMVVLAGSRRGMSGDCRPYSYLRSTWSVCLDALGGSNPALDIISISGVLPSVSHCFPEGICFIR